MSHFYIAFIPDLMLISRIPANNINGIGQRNVQHELLPIFFRAYNQNKEQTIKVKQAWQQH